MIWESSYWKENLLRQATFLRKRANQRRWPERSLAKLEQNIMLGFYSIRKLLEAKKLTTDIVEKSLSLFAHPWVGDPVNIMNWHKIDKLYDLERNVIIERSIPWLCNLVIHSYVFSPVFGEEGNLMGIFINSDRTKNEALYFIDFWKIIEVFETVGTDYANYAEKFELDPKTGEYKVVLRNKPLKIE